MDKTEWLIEAMKRRDFLKAVTAAFLGPAIAPAGPARASRSCSNVEPGVHDDAIRDYLYKMQHFDLPHRQDVRLDEALLPKLESCVARLTRLQDTVGHGHFHLLSFDEALGVARNYVQVGAFTSEELDFLEMVFYENASVYGFYGEKPVRELTDAVKVRDVVKVPQSGNYLMKGPAVELFEQIVRDVGDRVVLTSGVRGVPKQFLLFLSKALQGGGNLSLASRSLAPPGYSYHGVGDFDVGQVGFGAANFTERFTETDVCKRLDDLGYVDLRYTQGNRQGVRFEPWHIKVVH